MLTVVDRIKPDTLLALNKLRRLIGTDLYLKGMRENFCSSTSDNLPFPGLLRRIPINLRHSSLASASLAQVVLDLNIDIVLIQEPFALPACPPVLANVPPGFSSFHLLSEDHAYGFSMVF